MKEQFTPGPWKVSKPNGSQMLPDIIASKSGYDKYVCVAVRGKATADLIAAAPIMYNFIKRLYEAENADVFNAIFIDADRILKLASPV